MHNNAALDLGCWLRCGTLQCHGRYTSDSLAMLDSYSSQLSIPLVVLVAIPGDLQIPDLESATFTTSTDRAQSLFMLALVELRERLAELAIPLVNFVTVDVVELVTTWCAESQAHLLLTDDCLTIRNAAWTKAVAQRVSCGFYSIDR